MNLEAEHHLQVARLHHEVYSKPLDLRIRLAQIKQAEAEQWSHLTSSQASSSTAGTPAKVSGSLLASQILTTLILRTHLL